MKSKDQTINLKTTMDKGGKEQIIAGEVETAEDCHRHHPYPEIEKRGGISIYAHPFYEWVESNIKDIKLSLIKAVVTNLVLLGENGRTYFEFIANLRTGFTDELIKLYNSAEQKYKEGRLKSLPYWAMYELGYTGQVMDKCCPAYDVLEALNNSHNNRTTRK